MKRSVRFTPRVEGVEGRDLPSVALAAAVAPMRPVYTAWAYAHTFQAIDNAAGTFARTHNAQGFLASLSAISGQVPYGRQLLYPYWAHTATTVYNPAVPGSGLAMIHQLKAQLNFYVAVGTTNGWFTFR